MKKIALLFLLSITVNCLAQKDQKFNLNFEKYQEGKTLPQGWFKWGSYDLSMDTSVRKSGDRAAKISSDTEGNSFGCIAYKIPAKYKGSRITLEGYMKIENVTDGFAGLLMRIDGNGGTLAFDNMEKQGIKGTRDWKKYSVTLQYPAEAEYIFVAGILGGKGQAWFDDFVLTIDGKNVQTLIEVEEEKTKAQLDTAFDSGSNINIPKLTPALISNLELLGRVWGFLKYHHPQIAKGNYNWDYELFRFLPKYLEASNVAERDGFLVAWIGSLGALEKCDTCKAVDQEAFLKPNLKWIDKQDRELKEKLQYVYQGRNKGKHNYIELDQGAGNPKFKNENAYASMQYPDDGFRLLSLYRYWNMIEYFFPNKHLTDKNWETTLGEYIPVFVKAKNELEYELAVLQIIADIKDTHANLWGDAQKIMESRGENYAPFKIEFVEEKLVVVAYYNPESKEDFSLEIGDIITKINGKAIQQIVKEKTDFYPASNVPTRLRNMSRDMLRSAKNEIQVSYRNKSSKEQTKTLQLKAGKSLDLYGRNKKEDEKCYKMLDNGIGYVTLANIKEEDISKIKSEFKDAKGIIIDIRNYPSTFVPFSLGSFFVSAPSPFVKFGNANLNNPGEFNITKTLSIPSSGDTFQGKLVVLVNEQSQSQAEYTAMAFRAGDNTTIVGSTTAGADGNVSNITLPGGLKSWISGIGVYYPNGGETQRIGIVPDIETKPTIEGIRNGRDELLEKAIEVILRKKIKQ